MSDVTLALRKAYTSTIQGLGIAVFDEISNADHQEYAIIGVQTAGQVSNKCSKYMTVCRVTVQCVFRQRISSSRQSVEDTSSAIINAIRGNSLTLQGYLMHSSVMVDSNSETVTTNERTYSKRNITFEHNIEAI